jgi:hypothetical protein
LNANASGKSVGSVTARSGALDVRDASASSNGDTASAVAVTREFVGMERWVGLGVIAHNLINIGRVMEQAAEP